MHPEEALLMGVFVIMLSVIWTNTGTAATNMDALEAVVMARPLFSNTK